jgi:hypothetical protein
MTSVLKVVLAALFGLALLQFIYNFTAALRNRQSVIENFPGSGKFLWVWTLINAFSILCLVAALVLLWMSWPIAVVAGGLPVFTLIWATVGKRRRPH